MQPERIIEALQRGRRTLLLGPPGSGKSTFATRLAAGTDRCRVLDCDPGSPAFGVPGAICAADFGGGRWTRADLEPLCSLDAARFRLPLVRAVERLLRRAQPPPMLLDGPGLVRGVAAAELADALVAAAAVELVVLIERGPPSAGLLDTLGGLDVAVERLTADERAAAPSAGKRARRRTRLWDAYLLGAEQVRLDASAVKLTGTPPPLEARDAWAGRQAALLRGGECGAFGEIERLDEHGLRLRVRGRAGGADTVLIRDAARTADGVLATAAPAASLREARARRRSRHGEEAGPARVEVGPFSAKLLNGVFGDPLLAVRLLHGRRSLLFDLGDARALPARIVHRASDVFISHAHADHIAGFLSFLRARIGEPGTCRFFGPPGLAENVSGMVRGVHWDRIENGGPRFEIGELHEPGRLQRYAVSAARPRAEYLGEQAAPGGVLAADALLQVRAAVLDHRTPVLAFSLEPPQEINVRREALKRFGVEPGPWLTELKRRTAEGRYDDDIELPGGATRGVRELADALLLIRPGRKLVYATDLADSSANRRRLEALARDADTMFCEATFLEKDAARAERTGHLTTGACARIAAAAGVRRLAPFHFSRRYESEPARLYAEIDREFSGPVLRLGVGQQG